MRATVEIDAEEFAEQLDHEEAMELIIAIDLQMADYDFTLQLARHLVADLKKCATADEPFDISALE